MLTLGNRFWWEIFEVDFWLRKRKCLKISWVIFSLPFYNLRHRDRHTKNPSVLKPSNKAQHYFVFLASGLAQIFLLPSWGWNVTQVTFYDTFKEHTSLPVASSRDLTHSASALRVYNLFSFSSQIYIWAVSSTNNVKFYRYLVSNSEN